jgi:S-adenosylmethionine:tRNA ribosyltransferase-isomerase
VDDSFNQRDERSSLVGHHPMVDRMAPEPPDAEYGSVAAAGGVGVSIETHAATRVSLLTSDYDYSLPAGLIARYPLPRRDSARMMVLRRAQARIEHRAFIEFPTFIGAHDLVVLNDTRVIPARLFSDDGRVELLMLEAIRDNTWKCLVKPGKKMRVGATVQVQKTRGTVRETFSDGERLIEFDRPIDLAAAGELPLPPYLQRPAETADHERYQTVFARAPGAVAAPTAGLHFTEEILTRVPHTFITLHVGVGTFRPVQTTLLTDHRMHAERFFIAPPSAKAINAAERLIAVGTTTTRVLESIGRPVQAGEGRTDIFHSSSLSLSRD